MVKKIHFFIIINIAIFLAFAYISAASTAQNSQNAIDFYNIDTPSGYDYLGQTKAVFNTDYWHYSGGYWLDGNRKESRIYDNDDAFWLDPSLYYDRPGMNIVAEGALPPAVKDYLKTGKKILVSVTPNKPEVINMIQTPKYQIKNDNVYIYALPFFRVYKTINYPQYVSGLKNFIPIVEDVYGWNVYSIYKKGSHIGELPSSFVKGDALAIEFSELKDAKGNLKSNKNFNVYSSVTGMYTQANASDISIGNGEFDFAGAVGMWFRYEFDVSFYKYKTGDLEAVEIKSPNKVEAGKTVDCVVAIRNNSTISYVGEFAPILRLWDGISGNEIKVALSPGEAKDVRIPWTVPKEPGTYKLTVTINPDKTIEETNYRNNEANRDVIVALIAATPSPTAAPASPQPSSAPRASATPRPSQTPSTAVTPSSAPSAAPAATPTPAPAPVAVHDPSSAVPLPDFAVTGFREARYTTLAAVKSYVKVKYTGTSEQHDIEVIFSDGESTQRKYVDFAPNIEKEVLFEWLTPQKPGNANITAEVNPDRSIAESNYANNKRSYDVQIELPPVDLSLSSLTPARYPAGKQVVTLVSIKNNDGRDFASSELVEVKFSVPSIKFSSTKRVSIGKNMTITVPFYWTAPTSAGSFQLTAEANPSHSIAETNYANNAATLNAEAYVNANPPFGCDFPRQEWTETRHVGDRYTEVVAPDGTVRGVYTPIFKDVKFYAEATLSARLIPDTMKSGYGVECEITASISTNYDVANGVIPLQDVYAYLPTTDYKEAIKLELVPGAANRWRFPINPASVTDARVQYVPVSWPDGKVFRIGFTGRDAQSPGGAMCATTYANVMINGNMYEDDYTAPLY